MDRPASLRWCFAFHRFSPIDPIVEELRRVREGQAAEFGYDIVAFGRELQRQEKEEKNHPLVYPPPREDRKHSPGA